MSFGTSNHKRYLGDGVYVSLEDGVVVLTTEDGEQETNRIYLDDDVIEALVDYVERVRSDD